MTLVAIIVMVSPCLAQEVHVTPGKGSIGLSIHAEKAYELMPGEQKKPILSVQCAQKGKKAMHLVMFSAGGALAGEESESTSKDGEIALNMEIGGNRQITTWIPYGDAVTFAYYGKTEPERVKFLHLILSSPTVSIEFTPFLTGRPTVTTFDLSKLREEVNNHPECMAN